MRRLLALFVCTFLSLPVAHASENLGYVRKSGLSTAQGKKLIALVARYEGYDPSRETLETETLNVHGKSFHPGYLDFGLNNVSFEAGRISAIGMYSVSPLTGDVWETNLCKRYSFPELVRLQQLIQRRTGHSFSDEAGMRVGLGCPLN
jgi:hypothetical protein